MGMVEMMRTDFLSREIRVLVASTGGGGGAWMQSGAMPGAIRRKKTHTFIQLGAGKSSNQLICGLETGVRKFKNIEKHC